MITQDDQALRMAPAADRVHLIDALRAIALAGVILFNIMSMVGRIAGGEVFAWAGPVDYAFATFDLVFIQGKARACFALLFGVGFGILIDRAARGGREFLPFYLRRMTVLLLIGIANLAFLFWGDILILYALLGMVLLLFRGWSDKHVFGAGLALILLPPLIAGGLEAATGAPLPNSAGIPAVAAEAIMAADAPAYRDGSYGDFVAANLAYYRDHYVYETGYAFIYAASVLGLFLLGLWITRRGILADVDRWRPSLRQVAWWCLPIGFVLSLVHATRRMGIEAEGAFHGIVTAAYAGLSIMAFGYVAILCLWLTRGGKPVQAALAPIGRMALTGYLASNAIGAFVWYGWGLDQMGRWNVAAINALAITIFVALCLFSAAWIRAFRFGPAEWLWRSLTYGKAQPMRRTGGDDAAATLPGASG